MKQFLKGTFFLLPSSKTLTYNWNFGSLLGMILGLQLISGVILVFYYSVLSPFEDVQYLMYDVYLGWFLRCLHFNGASMFFVFIYLHMFKGLFVGGYRLFGVWNMGVIMIFLFMGVAFMGYVLVYSQMSYWAAVVITSLLTVVPLWGEMIVVWIWGGYSVILSTVKIFFVLHFLLPWLGAGLVLMHLIFLHKTGSSSYLMCHGDYDKILFFPSYWFKDGFNLFFFVLFFSWLLFLPFILGDGEMFLASDFMVSPRHIVPEWYFLYAYAILRAVPNKILGVVSLFMSIGILFVLGLSRGHIISKFSSLLIFFFMYVSLVLTWLGKCSPEAPYVGLSLIMSLMFFGLMLSLGAVNCFIMKIYDFMFSMK